MKCPKCKSENDDNALVCSSCGFKLKLKCPFCGNYNTVGAKNCASCKSQLLKVCPSCKAVNFAQVQVCRKCKTPFPSKNNANNAPPKVEQHPVNNNLLENAVSVAIELINISSIKNNIKSQELSQKIISKFYQVFAKIAKDSKAKAFKLAENVLITAFDSAPSFVDSVNCAVEFVENLDRALDEVSDLLEKKLKVSFKVRYLVSDYKTAQKNEIISAISLGVVDDIIFSEEVYLRLKDKMMFKQLETNTEIKFYKFLDENNLEVTVNDIPKEQSSRTRMQVVSELINKVQMAPEGFVVCLSGPTGVGKSNIFSALKMTFEEDNSNIWLSGQCNLLSSDAPLGFFRSLLRNMFELPTTNVDSDNSKTKIASFVTNQLNITNKDMLNQIIAIIFPDENKLQNTLYQNKQNTYNAIATLFRSLLGKGAVVLQIEDIEKIDSFSLEILRSLFEDGILKCNLKIFITANMDIDIIQFFASSHLNKNNTFQVNYPVMNKAEIDDFIVKAIGVREELGQNILNHIYEYSNNLPIFIEEFIYYLLQIGLIKFTNDDANPIYIAPEISNFKFPKTVQEIIQCRLTHISQVRPVAFKILYYASILGFKFLAAIVQNILQISNEELQDNLKYLAMNNFISSVDTYNHAFKNRMLWETIRNLPLSEDNKLTTTKTIINTMTQIASPDMAEVVENLLTVSIQKYDILNYIEQATKEAYCLGDDYSYVYYKSMLLEAVDLSTLENKTAIELAIKEELVGITYTTFPEQAIKYGEDLYAYYSENDEAKTIEILGILSVAFENIGNYVATIECVDKALEKIDPNVNQLAGMLLFYSKLNALFQSGRYEEAINLAQNSILPITDLYFKNKTKEITTLTNDDIKAVELETMYILAQSYALKGSSFALDAAQKLYDAANIIANPEYTLKAKLARAAILVLQGKLDEVQAILSNVQEAVPNSKDATTNTFIWLLLKDACAMFRGDYASVGNELAMLANFSKNVKKFALEPVVKGFIVKILLHEGNTEAAEQLAYDLFYQSSNSQWALGALVNWFMYCEIAIFKENIDVALKVAQNALDVAEKANTNNLFFTSLFKLKIAQIYSMRGDFDIAKINAQEALQIANDNSYLYIKSLYGLIIYDILLKQIQENPSLKNDNITLLYKYLLSAQEAVDELKNADLSVNIKQRIDAISSFAQENNITL